MTRDFFIVLIITVLMFSCNSKSYDMQKKMTTFGLDYTKAWNSEKSELVASFFEQDGLLIVNSGAPISGRRAISEFAKGFMTAFPDMKLKMDSLVDHNGAYNYHWTFRGTNSGPDGTGNTVEFSGFEQWTLGTDGLIKKSVGTYDEEDFNRQVQGLRP